MRVVFILLNIILTVGSLFLSTSTFASYDWNIVQDGDGFGQGFIVPNEFGYLSFVPYLKNQNEVLISVGTFRAFQAASMGEFKYVFLFDYAAEVVQFNKMLLDFIKLSRNRLHFLDLLFGTNRAYEKLENNNDSLLMNELSLNEKNNLKKFLRKIIQLYKDPTTYGANFLTSDYYFEKVKYLASNNRFVLINGSLSGEESLSDLSSLLKQRNLEVSVLDVSNAKDYIIRSKQLSNYYRNLKRLPWSKDAKVIWSVPAHFEYFVGQNIQNNWAYFGNPASDYVEFVQRLQNRDAQEVSRVYDQFHSQFMQYALPKIFSCNKLLSNN